MNKQQECVQKSWDLVGCRLLGGCTCSSQKIQQLYYMHQDEEANLGGSPYRGGSLRL